MRAVVQRVRDASVEVDGQPIAAIGGGMGVLVAASIDDTPAITDRTAARVAALSRCDQGRDEQGESSLVHRRPPRHGAG